MFKKGFKKCKSEKNKDKQRMCKAMLMKMVKEKRNNSKVNYNSLESLANMRQVVN